MVSVGCVKPSCQMISGPAAVMLVGGGIGFVEGAIVDGGAAAVYGEGAVIDGGAAAVYGEGAVV